MRIIGGLQDVIRRLASRNDPSPGARPPNPEILVFVPSYPGPKVATMECVLNLLYGWESLRTGINITLQLTGGAYIDAMRNSAILQMLKNPNCIGVLMIDHDAKFPSVPAIDKKGQRDPQAFNALRQLVQHDVDIVGALTTTRGFPLQLMCGTYKANAELDFLQDAKMGHPLSKKAFQVDWTACHFTYISRRAIGKIVDHYGADTNFFECSSRILVDDKRRAEVETVLERFKSGEIDAPTAMKKIAYWVDLAGVYQEDVSFCRRAKAAGCEIWIDPSFEVQHIGDYPYSRFDWLSQKMFQQEETKQAKQAS